MGKRVLVINPGATSTKIAFFESNKMKISKKIEYNVDELKGFSKSTDQIDFRWKDIEKVIKEWKLDKVEGVVGRGGLFKPLQSGIYNVNDRMVNDIKKGNMVAEHISNIGAILAKKAGDMLFSDAFIVDPVSVDEFEDVARISGIPEIERKALQHTLNIKQVIRRACKELKIKENEANFVVAHLGSGISICPIKNGKIVDSNNAIEEGPFSPERSGGLPTYSFMELCFSGKYEKEWIKKRLIGNGGIVSYLGTNDLREVEKMIKKGNKKAKLIYRAMVYQTAKGIGAMAAVLGLKPKAIILTGGLAHQDRFIKELIKRISFFTDKIIVYPGEDELTSMADAAFRVFNGEEKVKEYR
jgi:butyrate kinase